jgi:acyl-CoA thioester hydrolase
VSHVYTGQIRVRHDELDAFGRAHPSSYLRHLAQIAIDASTDAGFDARWYEAAGAHWLVRRTTFSVLRPARAEASLSVRTWVEDFRRVRSRRRYEATDAGGVLGLTAVTDWVFVDLASGRPRRVPGEMEQRFVSGTRSGAARPPWRAPAPPPNPGRSTYRVRWAELDALGHMNNAAYLDLLVQATLDVLAGLGWPIERLSVESAVPLVAGGDVEYLDEVRHDDRLETCTWFAPAPHGLDVHQRTVRLADGRAVVQASTAWRWADAVSDALAEPPREVHAALRPLLAA